MKVVRQRIELMFETRLVVINLNNDRPTFDFVLMLFLCLKRKLLTGKLRLPCYHQGSMCSWILFIEHCSLTKQLGCSKKQKFFFFFLNNWIRHKKLEHLTVEFSHASKAWLPADECFSHYVLLSIAQIKLSF